MLFLDTSIVDMNNTISNSLFQKNKCALAGIGVLSLETGSAETDFANSQIKSPYQRIVFMPAIEANGIENNFSEISKKILSELEINNESSLHGIGKFYKDNNQQIQFEPIQLSQIFFQPVTANRIIRENAEHNVLVGDRETNSTVMTEYFTEEPKIIDRWWIWAAGIAAIALLLLGFSFYNNGVGVANNNRVEINPTEIFHTQIK